MPDRLRLARAAGVFYRQPARNESRRDQRGLTPPLSTGTFCTVVVLATSPGTNDMPERLIPLVVATLCLAGIPDSVRAQDDAPVADASEPAPVLPPDPRKLDGNSWRYFEDAGELKTDRFDAARTRLGELVAQADDAKAAQALERFSGALRNLAELAAAGPPAAEAAPVLAPSYSLAELVELEQKRLELASSVALERGDTERLEEAAQAARRRLDARFAAYLGKPENAPARLTDGMQILADRATVAVAERRAARARATLTIREQSLAAAESAIDAARGRLQPGANALAMLAPKLDAARAAKAQADDALLAAEDANVPAEEDSPRARAASRLRSQVVVRASVDQARAEADLLRLEAHRDWVAMRTVTQDVLDEAIVVRHQAREAFHERVSQQRREWQATTQRELLNMTDLQSGDTELGQITSQRLAVAQETLQALELLRRSMAELRLVTSLVGQQISGRQSLLERGVSGSVGGLRATWATLKDLVGRSLFRIGDTPVTTLGIVRLLVILLAALWISRLFRGALDRFATTRATADRSAFYTIGRLAHYVIIVIGLVVGLSSIGLNFSNLALVAGALSVGIGFGLQSIVNNFVSGLIILFERSLKVGDFIELDSGLAGTVKEINVRSTLINTNDNIDIVVPNSEFVSARLTNWTLRDVDRRVHIPFGVAYGSDKDKVRKVVLAAAQRVPFTLTAPESKAPQVWLVEFGDSSLNFELVVWLNPDAVRRPSITHATYTWEIETALGEAGIEIPFPQRDLHLRSGFNPPGGTAKSDENGAANGASAASATDARGDRGGNE